MEHSRDEATEAMLGEIIAEGTNVVVSFFIEVVRQEGLGEEEGYVYDGGQCRYKRRTMFMMAPVTQWRYKKETVLTAPVTEPSPARYIYIS